MKEFTEISEFYSPKIKEYKDSLEEEESEEPLEEDI
jgi:hypothetical protein